MIVYVDSSVFLRKLLSEPHPMIEWPAIESGVVSRLAGVEISRVLDRCRNSRQMSDERIVAAHVEVRRMLETFSVQPVTELVLDLASRPMPTSIGTLAAIHLASAMLAQQEIGKKLLFATHDDRLALAARASGFDVIGC